MTDQLTALRELVAKVEAGKAVQPHEAALVFPTTYDREADEKRLPWQDACEASRGSLDAAKALHEALLPGWPFELRERAAWTNRKRGLREPGYLGEADIPARSWLIAILKAKIAELEATQ